MSRPLPCPPFAGGASFCSPAARPHRCFQISPRAETQRRATNGKGGRASPRAAARPQSSCYNFAYRRDARGAEKGLGMARLRPCLFLLPFPVRHDKRHPACHSREGRACRDRRLGFEATKETKAGVGRPRFCLTPSSQSARSFLDRIYRIGPRPGRARLLRGLFFCHSPPVVASAAPSAIRGRVYCGRRTQTVPTGMPPKHRERTQ